MRPEISIGRAVLWIGAVLICLAVFTLYLQPDFMVSLADQLWSCF